MPTPSDAQLLRDYAESGSEAAFRELVVRHTDAIYSSALRQANSPDLAADLTQRVFADLARKAGSLSAAMTADASVIGWLFRSTRYAALNLRRDDQRRQARERQAMELLLQNSETPADWEQIRPVLDEALDLLADEDREALLLRFFKNHDLRTVGATLGISDDAAQKRVSRAVERLREFFAKRGITLGASGLAVVISANAVQAAPVGLALTISTAVAGLTGATLVSTTTQTTAAIMSWLNLKSTAAVIAASIAAATGTYIVQQQSVGQLRDENQKLVAVQQSLAKEVDDTRTAVTHDAEELERREREKIELLRLRGEVTQLRRRAKEADQLAEQNRQMQEALSKLTSNVPHGAGEEGTDPEKRFAIEQMNRSKQICLALMMYADDNTGMLPTDLNSVSNYLGHAASELLGSDSFELVLQGALTNVSSPSMTIAIRSRQPHVRNGRMEKVYGFVDGHAEIRSEPAEGFEAWEKARMLPATSGQ